MSDHQPPHLQHSPRCAVVVTFDRLPLRLLGTYGSSLCQTPHLDRLAAQGCVFDAHFTEDLSDSRSGHEWWGEDSSDANTRTQGLAHQLCGKDVKVALVTDLAPAGWSSAPSGFETVRVVEASGDADHSSFANLLAAAEEEWELLEQSGSSWLLWIHASEMPEIPVSEMEFLELYLDELTQLPPETDEDDPQDRPLPEELRTEALDLISQTLDRLDREDAELEFKHLRVLNVLASARVSELDHYLGKFFERIERNSHPLLILTSDQGLSLGESVLTRQLDSAMTNCPLAEERVHIPLIVKTPELPFSQRCSALTQHPDVSATLGDWFGMTGTDESRKGASLLPLIRGEQESIREFGVSRADDWRSIRDSEWVLIENRSEGIERLYQQPEDRRQILDVLPHYIEIADRMSRELRDWEAAQQSQDVP